MPISVASPPDTRGLTVPLRRIVRAALREAGCTPGEIAIALSDDARLRELNRQYRKIDRATDVLSFAYDEGPSNVSGDIIVSMDRLAVQAKRYRVSRGRELARLVVHGALHLTGHDHHAATERRVMRAAETAVMRGITRDIAALDRVLGGAAKARAHR